MPPQLANPFSSPSPAGVGLILTPTFIPQNLPPSSPLHGIPGNILVPERGTATTQMELDALAAARAAYGRQNTDRNFIHYSDAVRNYLNSERERDEGNLRNPTSNGGSKYKKALIRALDLQTRSKIKK
jgi:hypothetical protein